MPHGQRHFTVVSPQERASRSRRLAGRQEDQARHHETGTGNKPVTIWVSSIAPAYRASSHGRVGANNGGAPEPCGCTSPGISMEAYMAPTMLACGRSQV